MDKACREFLLEHGYKEVSKIGDVIKQGKTVNLLIDVHNGNPLMLLARVHEKNVFIVVDKTDEDSRVIITQADRFKTHILNIPVSLIEDAIMELGKNMTTILFNVKGSSYTYQLCYQN